MTRARSLAAALALALLLLTGCGAQAAPEPTPEPTPTPMATPTPTPLPTSAPAALPDAGFEPESFWLAEPFGDGGKALLLMAADGRFKCWHSSWREHPEHGEPYLVGGSFTEAVAVARVEENALALEYAESRDGPAPERFSAASYGEALAAFLDMPYNDEAVPPVPERVSRADWEAAPGVTPLEADERYRRYEYLGAVVTYEYWGDTLTLDGFTSETPDFPFALRGLGLGSTLDEVLSRFPDGPAIETAEPERYRFLYGSDFGLLGTWDAYNTGLGGPCVSVSDGWTITRFIFGEDGRVCKIEFWASVD